MKMEKRILVTGGCGFIGSHIVDRLVDDGNYVRILDSMELQVHNGKKPRYLNSNAELMEGDVRDLDSLKNAIKDIDVIFHDAAAVGVGQSMYEIRKYVDVNTYGTAKLLEILVNEEHDVKKLIVASSMSIYGEGAYECEDCGVVYPKLRPTEQLKSRNWDILCPTCRKKAKAIPTSEEKPLYPTSIYAITKRDQEEMCLVTGKAYEIPTVALRYFNVYGPRQSLSNPYTGVAAIFSSRIKNNNPPIVFEDGLQSRDFIDVNDIVQANLLVMKKDSANYNAFNVGTGKPTSILDVATVLSKLYGKDIKPEIVNKYRTGDIRHCYADISKIRKIGFEPKVKFGDGMKELVEWGRTQEARDLSEKATQELISRNLVEK